MTELWEVLRPPPEGWPAGVAHVGSIYTARGTSIEQVKKGAPLKFPDALAVRKYHYRDENEWSWINEL